jgi:hypothetical protein
MGARPSKGAISEQPPPHPRGACVCVRVPANTGTAIRLCCPLSSVVSALRVRLQSQRTFPIQVAQDSLGPPSTGGGHFLRRIRECRCLRRLLSHSIQESDKSLETATLSAAPARGTAPRQQEQLRSPWLLRQYSMGLSRPVKGAGNADTLRSSRFEPSRWTAAKPTRPLDLNPRTQVQELPELPTWSGCLFRAYVAADQRQTPVNLWWRVSCII